MVIIIYNNMLVKITLRLDSYCKNGIFLLLL